MKNACSEIIFFFILNHCLASQVMESVFTVMKSNMTLILTVVTFIFSALLGGGTAILNFVLSSVSNRKPIFVCVCVCGGGGGGEFCVPTR